MRPRLLFLSTHVSSPRTSRYGPNDTQSCQAQVESCGSIVSIETSAPILLGQILLAWQAFLRILGKSPAFPKYLEYYATFICMKTFPLKYLWLWGSKCSFKHVIGWFTQENALYKTKHFEEFGAEESKHWMWSDATELRSNHVCGRKLRVQEIHHLHFC